jgi:hypothetical protein
MERIRDSRRLLGLAEPDERRGHAERLTKLDAVELVEKCAVKPRWAMIRSTPFSNN